MHGSDNFHMMNPCKRKTLELPILVQYKKVAMAHNKLRLMPPQLFPLGSGCTRPYIGIRCVVRLRDSTGYESCRDSLIKGMSQLPKSWNTYLKSNSQLPKSCSWQLHHAAISSWENTCILAKLAIISPLQALASLGHNGALEPKLHLIWRQNTLISP